MAGYVRVIRCAMTDDCWLISIHLTSLNFEDSL